VVTEYADSPWTEDALHSWAELEAKRGQYAKARELFQRAFDAYPTSLRAGKAAKRIADMKFALQQFDEAQRDYLRVLEIREWRGPLWPESLYQVGMILQAQGKLQEAFGYFQRVYVLYGGYPEWAARAYLQSGMVLEKLNRRREAIATYQEMMTNEAYRESDAAGEAEKRLAALL
jgi:TolA-binding protein